jgi:outer membrane protein
VIAQDKKGEVLTLRQCVETGIANNIDVLQAGFAAETDKIDWNQARLNLYPNLNASVNHGIQQGRSIDPFTNSFVNQTVKYAGYNVGSSVVLFNGFALRNNIKQEKLTYEASKMDLQQQKDNITIRIILAYLDVLTNEDLLALARARAELSRQQVSRLEILDRDGAIPPSQLSDLRGANADDRLSIINVQNNLDASKVALCQLMNVPYDPAMQLERIDAASFATRYEDTPDKIYQTALEQFALVKGTELRKESAAANVKVAKGQLFPILSLNGNASTNYSDAARNDVFLGITDVTSTDYVIVSGTPTPVIRKESNFRSDKILYGTQLNNNLFSAISLNLRVPIFNSLQARNRVKLARISYKSADANAKAVKTQLQRDIDLAYLNMKATSERYKTLLEQVAAYEASFRAADARFNAGLGTPIDYLTAKNNLDRANVNLVTSRYDFVLRTKVLDYYQGKQLW